MHRRCHPLQMWSVFSQLCLSLLLLVALPLRADDSVLSITGTDARVHELSLSQLEAMPQVSYTTRLPEVPGGETASTWQGVRLSELARLTGSSAKTLTLWALDDYSVVIPATDLAAYEPIVALRRDGQLIPIESLGPMIVVYPLDDHQELLTQEYYNRTIWQLRSISLE
ncbi:molybdopterin-dependent oxidoreductase [Pokkaliibacter sp. MBI-7]|uniref:molybdopterin-dependent oxidoreductase n=1 Tax=Pokkaliibacter sp. MBI-7 TaxID=3040600 RepID=UPI00244A3DC3|nr:molybdopterin-dependent oxidoreductase [Pokkaliibacter sp. MBI-7]MDH2432915.1 molybdopterin-dependent oxidoreductase [Pokkaliibacter sp. MBI-7]